MEILLYVFAGVYLAFGLVYALFVVLNKGAGIFSIPGNILLGPIYLPIQYALFVRRLNGRSARR